MADTVMKKEISATENTQSMALKVSAGGDSLVEFAKCDCCGLTEECTEAYISRVRERYQGRWICGLCAEAVKYEIGRSHRRISAEEALNRHTNFCKKFRSSTPPPNPAEDLISAVKQLLLRSLDSPRSIPTGKEASLCGLPPALLRSKSCYAALDR